MALILPYEHFMELVPQETMEFVNNLLPYLGYYIIKGNTITDKDGDTYSKSYNKKFLLACNEYYKLNSKNQAFLSSLNYTPNQMKVLRKLEEATLNDLFNNLSDVFCFYDYEHQYLALTPARILENCMQDVDLDSSLYVFSSNELRRLKRSLDGVVDKRWIEIKQEYEAEFYKNLPIETVEYLEYVSIAHMVIRDRIEKGNYNKQLISDNDEDLYCLTRLFGLFFYRDNTKNKSSNYITSMVSLLEKNGLTFEYLTKICGFSIYSNDINQKPNILILEKYYKEFIFGGINKDKEPSQIKVEDVFVNLFDRSLNNSLVFEHILSNINFDSSILDNFSQAVASSIIEEEVLRKRKLLDDFYKNLPKNSRDYIDFVSKCYVLLTEKLNQVENKELLLTSDDIDTLALLISSYYFNTDVAEFFKFNNINLDKVLKFLKVELTKSEIENICLNEDVLINVYKRFVYEGVNRNKYSDGITINDISDNLCNKDFNRSSILNSIFNMVTGGKILSNDFRSDMEKYLEDKKIQIFRRQSQELFYDIPADSIIYLENATKVHQYLVSNDIDCDKKDAVIISLLLALQLDKTKGDIKDFFYDLGFSKSKILNYFGYSDISESLLLSNDIDINLLKSEYGKFIFGGNNTGKSREDITVYSIVSNIFNKSLYNSVVIQKLLNHFDKNYDYFNNLDKIIENYRRQKELKKQKYEVNKLLEHLNYDSVDYIEHVTAIHDVIIREFDSKNCNLEVVRDMSDVVELSMLLGIFKFVDSKAIEFLISRGLTFDNICEYCMLDKNLFADLSSYETDPNIILSNYQRYISRFGYNKYVVVDEVIKGIFDSSINTSQVIENISKHFNINYDILKQEIDTGVKVVPVLTHEDRLNLIDNEVVPVLNLTDRRSILLFGESLTEHSKFIHSELPKLEMSDTHDKSIQTINTILNDMYQNEELPVQKKSFWAKLFSKGDSDKTESSKIVLKADAIELLKNAIDENLSLLRQEVLEYDFIEKYMKAYRRKNLECFNIVRKTKDELSKKLETIDKEDDRQYEELLTVSSNLQILNNKLNQFNMSNHLIKQELMKVNQTIVNHFITIDALETARNSLIPLIGSELAINKGQNTQSQALELSKNMVDLFKSILSRNVSDTVENIKKLSESSIDSDILKLLNTDITSYLERLENYKETIIGPTGSLIIEGQEDKLLNVNEQIVLTTSPIIDTVNNDSLDNVKVKTYKL